MRVEWEKSSSSGIITVKVEKKVGIVFDLQCYWNNYGESGIKVQY